MEDSDSAVTVDLESSQPTVAEVLERAARRSERASASVENVIAEARRERDRELGSGRHRA